MAEEDSTSGLMGDLRESADMLKRYARQETIDPLKNLGRYLGYGLGGSVVLGIGLLLLLMSGLRALQTETGSTFTGNLSWIPYFIVGVGLLIVIALASVVIKRGDKGTGHTIPREAL